MGSLARGEQPPISSSHTTAWCGLEAVDVLAHAMLHRASPVRFSLARSAQEREIVYRMRYRSVVEHGWASPEDFQDGIESDAYDEVAEHVVGWDGETPVASGRLVFPRSGLLLPTEEAFGVSIEPQGQVTDLGRQIVVRSYHDTGHRIFAALLSRCWLEIRARGFCYICGDLTPPMIRLYRLMGAQVKVLGPSRQFWGEQRQPFLCDLAGCVESLVKRLGDQHSVSP